MKVSIRQVGKPISQLIVDEKINQVKLRSAIFRLGIKTHNFMLEFIAKNTKTFKDVPQPDAQPLIETIDYNEYHDAMGYGWGIGDIATLNKVSKHWAIINYGGMHPQAGKKVPGYFSSASVFTHAPNSGHYITVGIDTKILPMDYIQVTRDFLDSQLIKIFLDIWGRG